MRMCHTIAEVRAVRPGLGSLGLVPTMGFLHEGHLSLVRAAKASCSAVAVTIFVNPTQFGPSDDLARYPRDEAGDLRLLEAEGVDLVFLPSPQAIYPPGFVSRVEIGPLASVLEGAVRPGHFSGVATVVLKLFNILQPEAAWFGQKDAQQCAVIRRLVRDFDMPVRVMIGETVRDADGLALSSRNAYLSPAERDAAAVLYRALRAARLAVDRGERDGGRLRQVMRAVIAEEPAAALNYASVADPESMAERDTVEPGDLALLAVRIGRTRLLDNLRLL
jgi:pantoate--beta-alanine ligase